VPDDGSADTDLDPRVVRSRQCILEATVQLMAERGVPAVSVEAIAERSGVAKTTIYRHWPTREALLVDAWRSVGYRDPPSAPAAGIDERVVQIALAVGTRISTPPMSVLLPDLLAAAERDPKMREMKDGLLRTRRRPLFDELLEATRTGALPADVDVELLVALIVGPIYYQRLIVQQPVTDEFVERVVAVALDTARHGLADRASAAMNRSVP
jgi:AcrR family transcriptional regulator